MSWFSTLCTLSEVNVDVTGGNVIVGRIVEWKVIGTKSGRIVEWKVVVTKSGCWENRGMKSEVCSKSIE